MHPSEVQGQLHIIPAEHLTCKLTYVNVRWNITVAIVDAAALALELGVPAHAAVNAGSLIVATGFGVSIGS